MPNKWTAVLLSVFTLALAASWAQEPGANDGTTPPLQAKPASEAPPTAAEKRLDEAIEKLKSLDTFAADINMNADMLGQVFQISGTCARKPTNKLLLHLTVSGLGDASAILHRACDGKVLWEFLRVLENPSLRATQLEPILKALQKPEADAEFRERVLTQLGFTGPDALLVGLRKAGQFDQISEETFADRPVWVIRGFWKDREALGLPGAQNQLDRSGFLPRYVPSYLALWIDQETGWPHQVLMQGKIPQQLREEQQLDPFGRPIGKKSSQKKERPSAITLTYKRSEREVSDSEFEFQPPENVSPIDETERRTSEIENAMIEFATRKRNEATQKSGEVLDQALPAPAPNPGEAPPTRPEESDSGEKFRSSLPSR